MLKKCSRILPVMALAFLLLLGEVSLGSLTPISIIRASGDNETTEVIEEKEEQDTINIAETEENLVAGLATGFTLAQSQFTVAVLDLDYVDVLWTPGGSDPLPIKYKSSKTSVVDIVYSDSTKCQFIGLKKGSVTISVTAGGITRKAKVTVTDRKVTGLAVSSYDYNALRLSWDAWLLPVSGYDVFRSTKKASGYKKIGEISTNVEFIDSTCALGKTYYYKVRAFKIIGGKKYVSPFSSVKAGKPMLAKPVLLSTMVPSGISVELGSTINGATGCQFYIRSLPNGKWQKSYNYTIPDAQHSFLTLPGDRSYEVRGRAYRKVGKKRVYSPYSDTVTCFVNTVLLVAGDIVISDMKIGNASKSYVTDNTNSHPNINYTWYQFTVSNQGSTKIKLYNNVWREGVNPTNKMHLANSKGVQKTSISIDSEGITTIRFKADKGVSWPGTKVAYNDVLCVVVMYDGVYYVLKFEYDTVYILPMV